jgi:hypothetical protein
MGRVDGGVDGGELVTLQQPLRAREDVCLPS